MLLTLVFGFVSGLSKSYSNTRLLSITHKSKTTNLKEQSQHYSFLIFLSCSLKDVFMCAYFMSLTSWISILKQLKRRTLVLRDQEMTSDW